MAKGRTIKEGEKALEEQEAKQSLKTRARVKDKVK